MATYRNVHISFWTDPKVDDDFSPEDKYFYLYLLTNPHTNICGCYEISMKQMTRETGYNEDSVRSLLNRMENVHGVIKYDPNTKEVFIPKWCKYNWASSEKVLIGVEKSIQSIKSPFFRSEIARTLSIGYGYHIDTIYGEDGYPMETTDSDTDTDSISDTDAVSDADGEVMPF